MSDRRPENPPFQLRVHYPHSSEHGQPASWDHILAVVRRGVESGTIKGEVVDTSILYEGDEPIRVLVVDGPGTYLLIGPVEDR